jgi:hypothetical protein
VVAGKLLKETEAITLEPEGLTQGQAEKILDWEVAADQG